MRRVLLSLWVCLMGAVPVLAQEGPRGSQLLFTLDDGVALWDAGRQEYEFLPDIDASEFWRFGWSWSPGGRYLLAQTTGATSLETRLYDVEARAWDARTFGMDAAWSPNGQSIVHVQPIENGAELLLYDWESGENTVLYSVQGDAVHSEGISEPQWSPNGEVVFFVSFVWGLGGTTNHAALLNLVIGEVYDLWGGWYASYSPVWSPDGDYFLLHIDPTETQTRGAMIIEDDVVGDIYLFDAHTGERQRVTHTPLQQELSMRWSDDGQTILYDVVETQQVALTEAFTLSQAADDRAALPRIPEVRYDGAMYVVATSPDGSIQVWAAWGCGLIISDAAGNLIDEIGHRSDSEECPDVQALNWRPLPDD